MKQKLKTVFVNIFNKKKFIIFQRLLSCLIRVSETISLLYPFLLRYMDLFSVFLLAS